MAMTMMPMRLRLCHSLCYGHMAMPMPWLCLAMVIIWRSCLWRLRLWLCLSLSPKAMPMAMPKAKAMAMACPGPGLDHWSYRHSL